MSIFLRWGVPAFVTVIVGTAAAVSTSGAAIPSDLTERTRTILSSPSNWATVSFDARDARITGTAASPQMVDELVTRIAAVHGVRSVTTEVAIAQHLSPFPFMATIQDGEITLSGGLPDEAARQELITAAGPAAIDELTLAAGVPDRDKWLTAARYALTFADAMDEGEVALSDLDLTISGRARTSDTYANVQRMREQGAPSGVSLAYVEVQPPLLSPFEWRAEYDGRRLSLSGAVPSDAIADAQLALTTGNAEVTQSLVVASGAPENFASTASLLLENLLKLQSGSAEISDATSTLSGIPSDPAVVESVLLAMVPAATTVQLEAPAIADYWFTAQRSNAVIVLDGFVPDRALFDRLDEMEAVDAQSLEVGRGAPDRFESGVDFVIGLLGQMSEGQVELRGTVVTIEGRAATIADYSALVRKLDLGAPQGLLLATATIKPPLATPFTFAATKTEKGGYAFSGHVPSDQARERFIAALPAAPVGETIIADGHPSDFELATIRALSVLRLLDSGEIAYDGANWTLTGAVDTPQKAHAAEAAFASTGLRTAGWTYSVAVPATTELAELPIVEPYAWQVRKAADGTVTISGHVPTEQLKRHLAVRSGGAVADTSELGAGAPDGFAADAVAGLDALLALDEGALSLSGADWSLTGSIATTEQRIALETELRSAIVMSSWRMAIQAEDAAPIVTPFTWSVTKGEDGRVSFAGYVPTEDLRDALAAAAGSVGSDRSLVGSGEPAGFGKNAQAAVAALARLNSGKASYDGSAWALEGQPSSASDAETLQAALAGDDWRIDLTDPVVPAVAVAEPVETEVPDSETASAQELAAVDPGVSAQPIERNFVFEATKVRGGPVHFRGIVPAEPMRRYLAVITGGEPSDDLTIGEGLPTTFIPSAEVGSRALARLADGRLGLDGETWVISGRAETEATLQAALEEIAAAPGRDRWLTDITLVPPLDVCKDKVGALAARNAILFESGSARIAEASLSAIDELAAYLAICPEASLEVEGHTDTDGDDQANLALSVFRAEAVVDALIMRGVGPERLYAIGYGESLPVASNDTPAGKQANRRIAFTVSGQ